MKKRAGAEPWEQQLRQALDAAADLGGEGPPSLADLQLFVVQVQREQRRQAARDLALFLPCAGALLAGALYAFYREPGLFLALQGAAAAALVVGAGVWALRRGQAA